MEAAVGAVGLAAQQAKAIQECYVIYSEIREIGNAHTEAFQLKNWEQAWCLDDTSSQQHQHPDPNDERHRFAVASLAQRVAALVRIAELQARYQSKAEESRSRKHVFSKIWSRSLSPGSRLVELRALVLSLDYFSLPENLKILANTELLLGLE
ncbi:hypothetical protein BDZ91DRAFT_781885, partial [Kalaharituber pfeilii]